MPAKPSAPECTGSPSADAAYSFAHLHWKSDATGPGRTLSISPFNPYVATSTIDLHGPDDVRAFLAAVRAEAAELWPHIREFTDG